MCPIGDRSNDSDDSNRLRQKCCSIILTLIAFVSVGTFYQRQRIAGELLENNRVSIRLIQNKTMNSSASVSEPKPNKWECCAPPNTSNPDVDTFSVHENTPEYQYLSEVGFRPDYTCEQRGFRSSNFSYYFGYPLEMLNATKWMNKSIYFAGGSTTRQMVAQLIWEMKKTAALARNKNIGYDNQDKFLFRVQYSGSGYKRLWTLDTRSLSPSLDAALASHDIFVLNVGTWWPSNSIGRVIDSAGRQWPLKDCPNHNEEWQIDKSRISRDAKLNNITLPDVSFSEMMRLALRMILGKKKTESVIVWRSETFTDCPSGSSFRATISPVLEELGIRIFNISEATCKYIAQDLDDSKKVFPHLCFPSVVLRYWLQSFQTSFL